MHAGDARHRHLGKDNNGVVVVAAGELVGRALAHHVDEHEVHLAVLARIESTRRGAKHVHHFQVASLLHFVRHVVDEAMIGARLLTHAVRIHEAEGVVDGAHQAQRVGVLLLGLAAKAGDEVAGEGHVRLNGANLGDQLEI